MTLEPNESTPPPVSLLPDEILVAELRAMVDRAPAEEVIRLAQAESFLTEGGFKIHERNIPTFRQRIRNTIRIPLNPPDGVVSFLQNSDLQADLFRVLSTEAIVHGCRELAVLFGRARFLTNIYLDPRNDLFDLIEKPFFDRAEPMDPPTAVQTLRQKFSPFLKVLHLIAQADPASANLGNPPETAQEARLLRERYERLQQTLASEKEQYQRTQERQKKRIAELEAEIKKRDQDKQKTHDAHAEVRAQLYRLQQERQQQAEDLNRHIQTRVQAELQSVQHAWLRELQGVENVAKGLPAAEVWQARLDRVLKQQADHDRHYGNIRTIELRIEALRNAKERLDRACATALKPLPETARLLSETTEELTKLEASLPTFNPTAVSLTTFEASIQQSPSESELDHASQFIAEAKQRGILSDDHHRLLCQKINMRRLYLIALQRPNKPSTTPPQLTGTIAALWTALNKQEPLLLLVDGYNFLLSLHQFSDWLENGKPGEKARTLLTRLFIHLADRTPSCQVRLFFDSDKSSTDDASSSVHVFFSGGTGEHRADQCLLRHLETYRAEHSAIPCYVVTNDRDLARKARQSAAHSITVNQMNTVLDLTKDQALSNELPSPRKPLSP